MTGTIELLVARSLALMTSLTEYEKASFLDQTIASEDTRELAIEVAARASQLAGGHVYTWQALQHLCKLNHPCIGPGYSCGTRFTHKIHVFQDVTMAMTAAFPGGCITISRT